MGKEEAKDIVLKAFIHCEGCSEQVSRCLRGFDGVEQVMIDGENQEVIVKGKKAEPLKVLERLKKKYSKNVELISPKLDPHNNTQEAQQQTKEQDHPPPLNTLILKTYIHCEGCARDVHRSLEKIKGVVSVDVNRENSHVVVRGVVNATQLVQHVKNRLGKHAEIVNQEQCCCCCKREIEKTNQEQQREINNKEDVMMFSCPPPPHQFSCQTFSDENVFSCSLM